MMNQRHQSCRLMASAWLALIIYGSAFAAADEPATTSSVYRIIDGRVVFPEYDDALTSASGETTGVALTVDDFPGAKVYREQILLADKTILSKPMNVSTSATTLSITARSRTAAEIFPRLRVSLVTADNNRHRLFEGYWQSISMATYSWPISKYAKGGNARLEIEMLNPGTSEEVRTWYFVESLIE